MASSPPPSPPPPPVGDSQPSSPPPKKTRQATRLLSLTTRQISGEKMSVSVDPRTGKVSGPHHTQFSSYLGTVAREKV